MALRGVRVFISRKDFPPQFIDSAQDILRDNGAEACICSNPSCNANTDFHVLPSNQQEKVKEYLGQGCNVIGPDCLLRCAKEHRPFPKQGYTCCLAMEGVKVLATGFEKQEKFEIERLVTAMCGEVETKVLSTVSFVVAKDVLAAKYKFSLNNVKRPILKIDWLYQCWQEHRLVPHEGYRLPPFAGLTICATNVPLEERKEIEEVCVKYGGTYSADLTKKCTHLIAHLPQGDKYKVARRWGTVKIVNSQWFGQCVNAKVCLDEELFPVTLAKDKVIATSQVSMPPPPAFLHENTQTETVVSSAASEVSNTVFSDQANENCRNVGLPLPEKPLSDPLTSSVEEENMYLCDCRIYFAGFSMGELRKYVNMVRDGGGTRHMEFSEKVTHVIVGKPSEIEMRGIRERISTKSVKVVLPCWLEDCNEQKKEVIVTQNHQVSDGLMLKAPWAQDIRHSRKQPQSQELESDVNVVVFKNNLQDDTDKSNHALKSLQGKTVDTPISCSEFNTRKAKSETRSAIKSGGLLISTSTKVPIFEGCVFAICESIPQERREEVVQWITEGGGSMEHDLWKDGESKINFLVVNHGMKLTLASKIKNVKLVSSHWIRFCLEEKRLLDLNDHVLYQPLQCRVPMPGFEALRICVSQYEDKDRLLLRNLCFVLGAKFTEKLTKRVSHLLCKVRDGQKYEAACKWNIKVTTAEWLFACVAEDKVLPLVGFQPRELSSAEKEAGTLGMTQCPSQVVLLTSGTSLSQRPSQTEDPCSTLLDKLAMDASVAHFSERNRFFLGTQTISSHGVEQSVEVRVQCSDDANKKSTPENIDKVIQPGNLSYVTEPKESHTPNESSDIEYHTGIGGRSDDRSDVAAAIEDLLAQTSKMKNIDVSMDPGVEQEISPEHITMKRTREQRTLKRAKLQDMSIERMAKPRSPVQESPIFEESQIDSQMIGYDEDHTGRLIIMERLRAHNMSSTASGKSGSWKNDGLGRLFKVAEANK